MSTRTEFSQAEKAARAKIREEIENGVRRLSPEEIAELAPFILPPVRPLPVVMGDPAPNNGRRRSVSPLHGSL
ncbi:MAG: hypothetical protein WCY68_14515 [Desulfuromonadales bacterium]